MRYLLFLIVAAPAVAHTISMSTGELSIDGIHARYEVRMPLYELQHVPHPDSELPNSVAIAGATRSGSRCAAKDSRFICDIDFLFAAPPAAVDVTCRFARITVPNHVHVLHARNGDRMDQAVFEGPLEEATLRFRPVGPIETAVRARPTMVLAAALVIGVLAVLGSGWAGLAACLAAYTASASLGIALTPRFLESAVALSAGYGAIEGALLSESRFRWIAAALIGAVLGAYSGVLLPEWQARAAAGWPLVITGGIAGVALSRYARTRKWLGLCLLGLGLAWFVSILL